MPPSDPATKRDLIKEIIVYIVATLILGGFGLWVTSQARAEGQSAIKDVSQKLDNHINLSNLVLDDYRRHKEEEATNHQLVLKQIEENRKDAKAVYDTIRTGRKQERLENPAYLSEDQP